MKTDSRLEKVLASGELAVTSECGPPRGCRPEKVTEKAALLKDHVDGINVTDNQTAMVRMSSCTAGILIKQMGLDPIIQMVSRDRNRLAMQSEILGAYSFGINTMLCLSGDHAKFGDHPMAQGVFDIDSVQMIKMVQQMRDKGLFQGGAKIDGPPKMFIGAAANPFADPFELRVMRLAKKIKAGVDFIQTQCIFNLDKFEEWMKGVVERGLDEQVHILAGITPMKSVGMARYMKNKVPGMDIPDDVIKRLEGVPKEQQPEEGIKMAVEAIERLKQVKGVHGFHIMAIEWEEKVPQIVEKAGLYPRPKV
ncbi:methylenetetrahydrofolate reductase [Desulfotignum phosphitoxidans]|uniref:Methylenetetrahydrofolate reductase n=1 Tax=Desulfotignum phosphitoxidans DSM 13687 TaxID=1286635 RepID=S0G1B5_9BACT|nr:methylenetetrahydrofolate reductase [Desulfotignum phosphitoxidans]EMS79239.1 bifunctional homocysteine S-methyltransferase/5,10-methylenetetrahydrofolate reductase YitJ [Desulfotignum phosphitoxidans DSM 13687]